MKHLAARFIGRHPPYSRRRLPMQAASSADATWVVGAVVSPRRRVRSGSGGDVQSIPISSAWRAISRRLERPSFDSTADTWWSAVLAEM